MKLIGIARLGRDAEVRYLQSGKAVANLSLAYNYGQKSTDGKRQSQWVDAALWGDQAEKLQQYLIKGTLLNVICRDVHIETYEGKNGTGAKLVGTVADLEFVPQKREEGSHAQALSAPLAPRPQQAPSMPPSDASFGDIDDGIPF